MPTGRLAAPADRIGAALITLERADVLEPREKGWFELLHKSLARFSNLDSLDVANRLRYHPEDQGNDPAADLVFRAATSLEERLSRHLARDWAKFSNRSTGLPNYWYLPEWLPTGTSANPFE